MSIQIREAEVKIRRDDRQSTPVDEVISNEKQYAMSLVPMTMERLLWIWSKAFFPRSEDEGLEW